MAVPVPPHVPRPGRRARTCSASAPPRPAPPLSRERRAPRDFPVRARVRGPAPRPQGAPPGAGTGAGMRRGGIGAAAEFRPESGRTAFFTFSLSHGSPGTAQPGAVRPPEAHPGSLPPCPSSRASPGVAALVCVCSTQPCSRGLCLGQLHKSLGMVLVPARLRVLPWARPRSGAPPCLLTPPGTPAGESQLYTEFYTSVWLVVTR